VGVVVELYADISLWLVFPGVFLIFETYVYVFIQLSADAKAREAEKALPDILQLMASNIRAGLTTDKALLLSARPEFGALAMEIKRVGKETMAGQDLVKALRKTTKHIRSKNLERTIDLLIQSITTGGKLADLLEQTASDLRDQQIIQKEVSASVLMYVLFIFIAIGAGAPLLFAMSSFLVKLLTHNMALIAKEMPDFSSMSAKSPISISVGEVKITPDFIQKYALICLLISSVFGSLVMGLIMKGEEREGFKFIPFLILLSVGLFFLASYILEYFFGGMMTLR